jgi:hypothetical protein
MYPSQRISEVIVCDAVFLSFICTYVCYFALSWTLITTTIACDLLSIVFLRAASVPVPFENVHIFCARHFGSVSNGTTQLLLSIVTHFILVDDQRRCVLYMLKQSLLQLQQKSAHVFIIGSLKSRVNEWRENKRNSDESGLERLVVDLL